MPTEIGKLPGVAGTTAERRPTLSIRDGSTGGGPPPAAGTWTGARVFAPLWEVLRFGGPARATAESWAPEVQARVQAPVRTMNGTEGDVGGRVLRCPAPLESFAPSGWPPPADGRDRWMYLPVPVRTRPVPPACSAILDVGVRHRAVCPVRLPMRSPRGGTRWVRLRGGGAWAHHLAARVTQVGCAASQRRVRGVSRHIKWARK